MRGRNRERGMEGVPTGGKSEGEADSLDIVSI